MAASEIDDIRELTNSLKSAVEALKEIMYEENTLLSSKVKHEDRSVAALSKIQREQIANTKKTLNSYAELIDSSLGKGLAKLAKDIQHPITTLTKAGSSLVTTFTHPVEALKKFGAGVKNTFGAIGDVLGSFEDEYGRKWNSSNIDSSQERRKKTADFAADSGLGLDRTKSAIKSMQGLVGKPAGDENPYTAYLKAKEGGEDTTEAVKQLKDALAAATGDDSLKELDEAQLEALVGIAEQQAAAGKRAETFFRNSISMLSGLAKQLDGLVEDIAQQRTVIDTRLAGSKANDKSLGSYWRQITFDFSALMASPLISQKDLMTNLISAVNKGISRDVEQFAMLETMKDKIASTFNTYDSTVLRLIKVQDTNTTAVRLGMEVTLNEMLNQMYESTEYLGSIAESVRGQLAEAEALMDAGNAVEFEYQVQKWLGSMYSVGVSNETVQGIAGAIGKLASGNIEGISSGGISNALIMAANSGNMSLSSMLANGLDASQTNVLLNNTVSYMAQLVNQAGGNKVVLQQLAKTFGMTASDLKAITNIISDEHYVSQKDIFNYGNNSDTLGYLYGKLYASANSMYSRISTGQLLETAWDNVKYSTAAGMASNPVAYMTNKIADVLDSVANGISIPAISVMGNMVDTKLKVSDIMRTASMLTGFTTSLVSMIGAAANGGNGFTGSGLLKLVGVEAGQVKRGLSTSSNGSGTITNASIGDIQSSAESSANDQSESTMVSAKEESTEVTNTTINESILSIYNILQDVVSGASALNVNVKTQPIQVSNGDALGAWTR